jgi:hypothetical protein
MKNITLLTKGISSPKLAKDQSYLTYILYLASATYKKELCPNAGDCMEYCLITKAGRGAIGGPDNTIQRARKRKSDWLLENPPEFKQQLIKEIYNAVKQSRKLNIPLAIRLNGGSDLDWSDIYEYFEDESIVFYEYTKRPELALKLNKYKNVHVTYSHNERTTNRILGAMIEAQINVAMVFHTKKGKPLPSHVGTLPVIDGDLTDLRFLDAKGVIVGLRLKSLRKVSNTNTSFIQKAA